MLPSLKASHLKKVLKATSARDSPIAERSSAGMVGGFTFPGEDEDLEVGRSDSARRFANCSPMLLNTVL